VGAIPYKYKPHSKSTCYKCQGSPTPCYLSIYNKHSPILQVFQYVSLQIIRPHSKNKIVVLANNLVTVVA